MIQRNDSNSVDADGQAIVDALAAYVAVHPQAEVRVQRLNKFILRVRVIDPDFRKLDRVERDTELWHVLDSVPEPVVSQITMVLALTPEETATSGANMEFEHPASAAFERQNVPSP